MKQQRWSALLLCAVMLFALPLTAAAEEPESGFYDIGTAARVGIVPLTADGGAAEGVLRDVDGSGARTLFYPGSRALRVSVSDAVAGMWYLLTVSAGDTVLYADQRAGGPSVAFDVSFVLPEQQTGLLLCIGSNEPGFVPVSLPLSYTPAAAQESPNPDPSPVAPELPGTDPSPAAPELPGTDPSPAEPEPSDPDPSPAESEPTASAEEPCPRDGSCPMAAYSDLDVSAWYHDGVHFVLERGIMNGVGEGSFAPSGTASRAMLVTMLWRMEGEPRSDHAMDFADVPESQWYAGAVRWAAANGIVGGYSAERFGPNDSVSREQLAVILWRYARYKGIDAPPDNKVDPGVFIDAERISDWARDGVQWAVDAGLLTGVGNEKLSPETDANRAQVATMLMRYRAAAEAMTG